MNADKGDLMARLAGESGSVQELHDKVAKLTAQKGDVEAQLQVSLRL